MQSWLKRCGLRGGSVGVAVVVAFAMSVAGPAWAQDKKGDAAAKPKPPRKMMISGMSSGVLRVPEVTTWECAGGAMGGCNPNGVLAHGTEVMRHEIVNARGHKWARIKTDTAEGWVKTDFLKPPGS